MLHLFRLPRGQEIDTNAPVEPYWDKLYDLLRIQLTEWTGDAGALPPTVADMRASYVPMAPWRRAYNGLLWVEEGTRPEDITHPTITVSDREPQTLVGRAELDWRTDHSLDTLELGLYTIGEFRRRGIATAALRWVADQSRAMGRPILECYAPAVPATGPTAIAAPTGGAIDPTTPGTAFARARGFRLAHVEMAARFEPLETLGPAGALDKVRKLREEAGGSGYELITWSGQPPRELLSGVADMFTGFGRDMPAPEDSDREVYDAAKAAEEIGETMDRGYDLLFAAARVPGTGELVGYTIIVIRRGTHSAHQQDTWVHPDHRGRRLSWHLKLANLTALLSRPDPPHQLTTYIAEENASMWAINRDLGFRPREAVVCWKTRRDEMEEALAAGAGHGEEDERQPVKTTREETRTEMRAEMRHEDER